MANFMHRGAGAIAKRVLGENSQKNQRVVYRWASEVPPGVRPFTIHKDGRTIFAWEADIAAAGRPSASSTTEDDNSAA